MNEEQENAGQVERGAQVIYSKPMWWRSRSGRRGRTCCCYAPGVMLDGGGHGGRTLLFSSEAANSSGCTQFCSFIKSHLFASCSFDLLLLLLQRSIFLIVSIDPILQVPRSRQ